MVGVVYSLPVGPTLPILLSVEFDTDEHIELSLMDAVGERKMKFICGYVSILETFKTFFLGSILAAAIISVNTMNQDTFYLLNIHVHSPKGGRFELLPS